jgi:hypothetical protein
MTTAEAAAVLRRVLALQSQGRSWRHIAVALGLPSPQAAKKAAHRAAAASQRALLRNTAAGAAGALASVSTLDPGTR